MHHVAFWSSSVPPVPMVTWCHGAPYFHRGQTMPPDGLPDPSSYRQALKGLKGLILEPGQEERRWHKKADIAA